MIPECWRWLHRLYAARNGYFWLSCPLCSRMFGGHEWRNIDGKPSSIPDGEPGVAQAICPPCTRNGHGYEDFTVIGHGRPEQHG